MLLLSIKYKLVYGKYEIQICIVIFTINVFKIKKLYFIVLSIWILSIHFINNKNKQNTVKKKNRDYSIDNKFIESNLIIL